MIVQNFTEDDIAKLPELEPEGWGDIRPRFRYFLQSDCCKPVKIEEDGRPVAVGTSIFHADTVWFACIITHGDYRKRGLGGAITSALIENVDRSRFKTIYLDATEFGYPVYLKKGFEVEGLYAHLKKENNASETAPSTFIRPFSEHFRAAVFELDQFVSGEDRRRVMAEFLADAHIFVDSEGRLQGVYFPSWSDGPIIAANDNAGFELMRLRALERQTAILPLNNTGGIQFLQENGFAMYRTSRRMRLGPQRVWHPQNLYNRISGALG